MPDMGWEPHINYINIAAGLLSPWTPSAEEDKRERKKPVHYTSSFAPVVFSEYHLPSW